MTVHAKKLTKMQQIDFLLIRKVESVELRATEPHVMTPTGRLPTDNSLRAYRDYWFHRGRREAFMEIRVMLKTEMGA